MSKVTPLVHNLHKKNSMNEVLFTGDYTFINGFFHDLRIRSLYLDCPFCNIQTIASHTLGILSENPLSVEEPLTCPTCGTQFFIKDGKAERVEIS